MGSSHALKECGQARCQCQHRDTVCGQRCRRALGVWTRPPKPPRNNITKPPPTKEMKAKTHLHQWALRRHRKPWKKKNPPHGQRWSWPWKGRQWCGQSARSLTPLEQPEGLLARSCVEIPCGGWQGAATSKGAACQCGRRGQLLGGTLALQ